MRLRETAPWLAVFAVILAGVLVWNGLWGILFEHNDQYRIRTLEIVPGALTTREEIVSVAGLREGDGLFAKGADEIRRSLLVLDRIDRVDASLRPPDALRVAVVDRVPVVRLRGKGQPNLYADANDAVFVLAPEKSAHLGPLPVVENGGDPLPTSPRPGGENAGPCLADPGGMPAGPEARAARAVRLVRTFNGPFSDDYASDESRRPPFEIDSLDVSNPLWLVAVVVQGADTRVIRFLWEEIPDEPEMLERLRKVAAVLREPSSAGKGRFDVIRTDNGEIQVHADNRTF